MVSLGQTKTLGYVTLRKLDAVSQKCCQMNMQTATMRMFGVHLIVLDSVCKREGYFLTGIYEGACNTLYCLEEFKCCKMKQGN